MPDPIKVPAVILCRLFTFHNFDEFRGKNSNFENHTKLGHSNVCQPMNKRDTLMWDPLEKSRWLSNFGEIILSLSKLNIRTVTAAISMSPITTLTTNMLPSKSPTLKLILFSRSRECLTRYSYRVTHSQNCSSQKDNLEVET